MHYDLTETLLWLCRFASPTGHEDGLCTALAERLGRASLAHAVRRYGDSLVVPVTRGSCGPHVALLGHLDVVPVAQGGPPRVDGDRLYAAGASDMKSGLALMLDLAERSERPGADLTLVFYAREEGPFAENELGRVLEEDADVRRADIAVCLEPSDNRLQLGCGGSLHATVTFRGTAAHSARPWQGENAIHKAAPLLARLSALAPEASIVDGLSWMTVASATTARGGSVKNAIPDLFELNVNYRFGPDQPPEQVSERVRALCGPEAEVRIAELAPAAPPLRHHPLVAALAACGVPAMEAKQAWTDVARFAALGVPAVNLGPGVAAQAHQRDEWTSLRSLYEGRELLSRWLRAISK